MDIQCFQAFFLLLLLPVLLWLKRKTRERLSVPSVGPWIEEYRPGFRKRYLDELFLSVIFLAVVLSLANIGYSRELSEEFFESKWIFLALDVSGSMRRQVSQYSRETLGDLALDGAESFIDMRGKDDYIGIVGFSSYPRLIAPLTFDRNLLKKKLELLRPGNQSQLYRELSAGGGTNASEAVWLALSAFFSMLPEKNRMSIEDIARLRTFLLGSPGAELDIPERLKATTLGRGMAVILFTDGRIEPSLRAHGHRNTPNLVNVIRLMKTIGIKLYIIAVGGDIDEAVKRAMAGNGSSGTAGKIFVTSKFMNKATVGEVYREIDRLEKNKNLTRVVLVTRSTKNVFAALALLLMTAHLLIRCRPGWRRI